MLRYIEGKSGEKQRKKIIKTEFYMEQERPKNPYNLPKSYESDRTAFKLPKECNNILLISDLHIPYHNVEAITTTLDYGKKEQVNCIFINGDLIDNHMVSKFQKDPKKRSIKQEFEAVIEFFTVLRKEFHNAAIYWLKGNHCIRWEKFLLEKVHEIWDDEYFTLEARLNLKKFNVTLLDDKILVKAGKLAITHGHHVFKGFFSPVNPARGAFLRAKQSIIVGHLHNKSIHTETNLDGDLIVCHSTGCLCELRADYSPIVGNCNHGFAHIKVEDNGNYRLYNYQIINVEIY
jgi:predicted phosphodiesterase